MTIKGMATKRAIRNPALLLNIIAPPRLDWDVILPVPGRKKQPPEICRGGLSLPKTPSGLKTLVFVGSG
jgi:hypothetical protein